MTHVPEVLKSWSDLRRHTAARVALGRVGSSLPTAEVLGFSMAHARARDAVHLALDAEALAASLAEARFASLQVRSQAPTRAVYLQRPDLGRLLHPDSRRVLHEENPASPGRLTILVADGLSALACKRHALPLLRALRERCAAWQLDSIIIATQARVALSDAVGELRHAEAAIILLGERPGLSSPDSLGAYMTYRPRPGRSDAERNCVSNIHGGGLSYDEAANTLHHLLERARLAGVSGVSIKDESHGTSEPPRFLSDRPLLLK